MPAPERHPSQPSPVAQRVFDLLLRTRPTGLSSRLCLRIGSTLRQWLVKRGDPLVKFELDGLTLLAPLSHELAFIRRNRPQYATNLARIAVAVLGKYPALACIDVGANIGDTVAVLRAKARFPILCVEGDPAYARLLEHNTAGQPDVERAVCLLADGREFAGQLATSHGSGRLVAGADAEQTVRTLTLQQLLGEHPRFRGAKLLKVDTDGFDLAILRAAMPWLAEARPVVFFEYDPHLFGTHGVAGMELLRELAAIGYGGTLVHDNDGDFHLSAALTEVDLWEDVHHYYSDRGGRRYADVCVFHHEDRELHDALRKGERQFFQHFRASGAEPAQ